MSEHTQFYVDFFTMQHRTDKQYGINQEEDAMITEVARENAQHIIAQDSVIRYHADDRILHTEVQPFCADWECPCHADVEAINAVTSQLMSGLLTWHEANMILRGQTI